MAISLTAYVLGLLAVCVLTWLLRPLLSPLRVIPGPLLARFSRFWFLFRIWTGHFELDIVALHRKYGSIVRYGPYHYCFNNPQAIQIIYGHGSEFDKSSWYQAWNAPGFKTMFTEPSVKAHGQLRRRFQSTFTMSSMVSYEVFAEHCVDILCRRFEEVAGTSGTTDLYPWLLSYAGDAVSMITYSKRMGFLDKGDDVGGFFKNLHGNALYSALVGVYAEIHPLIFGTMAWMSRLKLVKGTPRMFITNFNSNLIAEKRKERAAVEKPESIELQDDENAPKDFLSKFLDFHEQDASKFTERDINVGLVGNIIAGSDTTAAALTATMYCLLKNPSALAKLRDEISTAAEAGNFSSPPTFKEASELPYLHAVFQEAMRLHAPVGLPLQRVVPSGGSEICGHWFPGGTVVGAQVTAVHRNPAFFGVDCDEFRPERWMELDKEKAATMHRYWIPFGLGSRTCIGKNISMLEMTKLVPQLVMKFDFELTDGLQNEGTEMGWYNMWFVRPKGLPVKVSVRQM